MPTGQVSNDQMLEIINSNFQRTNDPSYLHRILVSKYLNLPGVCGFWGPSMRCTPGPATWVTDMSGGGYHLQPIDGNCPVGIFPGYHAWWFADVNYLNYADNPQWDITGTEAFVLTGKGLAMTCWINGNSAAPHVANEGLICKYDTNAANQASWIFMRDWVSNNGNITLLLSATGADWYAFRHTKTINAATWYFIAATYSPGIVHGEAAGVRIWVNDTMEYHAIADAGTALILPASIFNSTAALQLGSYTDPGPVQRTYNGWMTNWAICGNYVTEADIWNLWETTKLMTGFANQKGTSW